MLDRKLKVARVSTVPFFIVTQLSATIRALKDSGAAVTVISSDDDLGDELRKLVGSDFLAVKMVREINPLQDLVSLFLLIKIFKHRKFDIVHSTTPKAGLLCAIAGKIAGVNIRLHTFTGQPWVTMHGLKRHLLKLCDRVIGTLNTSCYTDSFSQQKFLVEQNVVKSNKIRVLGHGSFAGVDLERFSASRFSEDDRKKLKSELNIDSESKVVIFVGRITKEKGVSELVEAFGRLVLEGQDLCLLLVGPYEPDGFDIIDNIINASIKNRIKIVGFSNIPEKYMAIADLLCLPSYREGFGTVVIEAAAMGLPTVGTCIYGLSDAVVDGETGLLVPVGDSVSLANSIRTLVDDEDLLMTMANSARSRAQTSFDSNLYSSLLIDEYSRFVESP
ncbi:glycosyltransferase family 4 protein [Pseudomonas sp. SJZ131]|uniref:glycosyltransferase family 4 protein n=1 Tax=Pseudomonas sp. SJZ131 TaxID=2572895 RepID=UPI0011999BE9|nr:glycosyltransferase family 4 protein [Pseudomonas sp. SJZ131]TWD44509.1 glycosyltransferase involved in cell wall biosynthesis [Pseudomonas sp. SJZ131]